MGTIIVGSAMFAAFGYSIYKLVKKPKGSCSCDGCTACSMHEHSCH